METNYSKNNLTKGECTRCYKTSDEILIGDGRCVDCVDEQKSFEKTMRGFWAD